jgi:undecaprenyl-diphosphatase
MSILQAILIAIIEGLTEFLPISSTGHMVITSAFMRIEEDPFTKYFEVSIQLGAILSVVFLYFKRFLDFRNPSFYLKLLIAVIPSLILGKLLNDFIDDILGKPMFIAVVMIAGGVLLLFVDRWFNQPAIHQTDDIDYKLSLKIGLFQCFAIIFPGLSRSAATIIGGMSQKVSREAAAEFSFFLAVPTMCAATAYKTMTYIQENGMFTPSQWNLIALGNLIAFIGFVKDKGFKLFGYYRIALGVIVIVLLQLGLIGTAV